jgi:hypothetical protein
MPLILLPLLVALVLLALYIAFHIFIAPKHTANDGEWAVALRLQNQLPKNIYLLINNLTLLKSNNETTQIDHIVLSPFGIFVIETKHWSGWIFGSANDKNWTQKLRGKTKQMHNPLHQNYGHCKALGQILHLKESDIFSMVVFTDKCELKTQMPKEVMHMGSAAKYIMSYRERKFSDEQVERMRRILEAVKLERNARTDQTHIENVRRKVGG